MGWRFLAYIHCCTRSYSLSASNNQMVIVKKSTIRPHIPSFSVLQTISRLNIFSLMKIRGLILLRADIVIHKVSNLPQAVDIYYANRSFIQKAPFCCPCTASIQIHYSHPFSIITIITQMSYSVYSIKSR